MPRSKLTAGDIIRVIERTRSGQGVVASPHGGGDGIHDIAACLSSKDVGVFERRVALRAIAAEVLKRILMRLDVDGESVSVPLLDVSLRYLRFLADLDVHEQTSEVGIDPIDLLMRLTGLDRDELLSLYHKSSVEKFREATVLAQGCRDASQEREETTE